jgi:beta-lactamase regulating signal transducer with metallopeptidase domain
MNSLTDLAANPFVHRLGWALVHSLWQMAAVGAALAVALAIVPRRRATVRYACACAALLASMALLAGTFAVVTPPRTPDLAATNRAAVAPAAPFSAGLGGTASSEGPRASRADTPAPAPLPAPVRPTDPLRPQSPSLLQEAAATLQPALPWLVLLWTLGVLLVGLWHTGGVALTWRLRRLGREHDAGEHVLTAVRETAQRLGIGRAVRVLACARAAGPAVVGVLRPVILLPAALLSGLTPAQLQALIAHELAHVRRHDYLANLVQVAIESVLFYHPATWWIGRAIRRERESCCDDLAVSAGANRYDYARALTAAADHGRATPRPHFAMAAEGGSLMQRIQRLLSPAAAGRGDVLRRSALAGLLAVALAAAIVGCSLTGPAADAGTSTPSAAKPPQMRIAAVADANEQYDVLVRLPDDNVLGPRMRVLAGQAATMAIGKDGAQRQSLTVTVAPDGTKLVRPYPAGLARKRLTVTVAPDGTKSVRATYHVILAVKGGFRQWTQRNVPWPLGEWKDLSEEASAPPAGVRPVREARTQGEALRLAKSDDLPAVEHADRVVVEQVFPPGTNRKLTITDAAAIKKLREAMTVRAMSPSAGMVKWQIGFYRGKELLRTAWVYPDGEWGFQRPKSTSWTLGANDALPEVIGSLPGAPAASEEAKLRPAEAPATRPATQPGAAAAGAAAANSDAAYRAIYERYKGLVLAAARADDKDQVRRITEDFASLDGRLIYVRLTRIDPGPKYAKLIQTFLVGRAFAVPAIDYADHSAVHVTHCKDNGGYVLIETNRQRDGSYADDVYIVLVLSEPEGGAARAKPLLPKG